MWGLELVNDKEGTARWRAMRTGNKHRGTTSNFGDLGAHYDISLHYHLLVHTESWSIFLPAATLVAPGTFIATSRTSKFQVIAVASTHCGKSSAFWISVPSGSQQLGSSRNKILFFHKGWMVEWCSRRVWKWMEYDKNEPRENLSTNRGTHAYLCIHCIHIYV